MLARTPNVQSNDRNQNQLQSNILSTLFDITQCPLINGNLLDLTDFDLADNPTEISHNLGRALVGYIIVRNTANSTVWDSQILNLVPSYAGVSKTLLVNVSADTSVQFYVF